MLLANLKISLVAQAEVTAQQGGTSPGGFSQIAVLDGADWVNCRAMICSCRNELRCGGREEEQIVPEPGHSWAQQGASHSSEEGRS